MRQGPRGERAGRPGPRQPSRSEVRAAIEVRQATAARMVRMPSSTVRRWVRVGLVAPARVEGRIAWFGEAELARLRLIRRLQRDLGLNLAGVEVALRLLDEIERLRSAPDGRTGSRERRGPRRG